MVVEEKPANRFAEIVRLNRLLRSFDMAIDLLVVSDENFQYWRDTPGNVYYEAATEGQVLYEAAWTGSSLFPQRPDSQRWCSKRLDPLVQQRLRPPSEPGKGTRHQWAQQQLQLSPRIARRPSMKSIGMATNAAPESTHER